MSSGSQIALRKTLRKRRISIVAMAKPKSVETKKRKPAAQRFLNTNKASESSESNPKKSSPRQELIGDFDRLSAQLNPKKATPREEEKSKIKNGKPTNKIEEKGNNDELGVLKSLSIFNENNMDYDSSMSVDHVSEQENEKHEDDEMDSQFEPEQLEAQLADSNNDLEVSDNDGDAEPVSGNCIEGILKGFNKDIGALYTKTNNIESELKEIKRLLKSRPAQHCTYRTLSSQLKENSVFSLLPKFPLLKKSAVRKMESDTEENEDYKSQMIKKLASYGGGSIQEIVINIFNKLFCSKLKTKYCWRGSSKGKGKGAFKKFTNIIEVIWSAVKVHSETCTEAMVKKQIKLRLNQAQKDYDREMKKQKNE